MPPLTRVGAEDDLRAAIATVPTGRWAVGVSGGADSVALLLLLRDRPDLSLHVVHLDHQSRGDASTADAAFVGDLAARSGLPSTVARRNEVEATLAAAQARPLPANLSARFRALRIALFRQAVAAHDLAGVILAHHADDVAETVLLRLLRGSGSAGLAAIAPRATVGGLLVVRPLLGVRRGRLREFLASRGQSWREDASNASDRYARNRVRMLLEARPDLTAALREVGDACRELAERIRAAAPEPALTLEANVLRTLPPLIAREHARRWLAAHGVPPGELEPAVLARLVDMATDAASPAARHFPGGVLVRRRGGVLFVDAEADPDAR